VTATGPGQDAQGKVRRQDKGHRYAEQSLVGHGAAPLRPGEDPRTWLRQARSSARVRTVRHQGCHRFLIVLGRTRRDRDDVRIGYPGIRPYPKTRETRELVSG
jgi:hypothetical protein